MARIPIKKEMLRWALNDASVSEDEIARLTGRQRAEVDAWLSGDSKPFKGDLEKVAKRVGRSMQFFLLPRPPEAVGPAVRFRGSVTGESRDPASELKALRRAGRLQKLLRWDAESHDSSPIALPVPGGTPEQFASVMRTHLGWTEQEQRQATSKSAAFKALRRRVESLGIGVLYIDAGEGNCRGFSLPDPLAPMVALNSKYNLASLRSFTLLHELAHLARGTAAVCHDPNQADEKWCDTFASAFLLPEASVRAYFGFKGWDGVSVSQISERIRLTSDRYRASWQAVAIRLKGLGLASQAVVDEVFANSGEDNNGFARNTRHVEDHRFDEFGATVTRAVIDLREENKISEFDARQQLRVDRSQFAALKMYISGAA